MNYTELLERARPLLGPHCRGCAVCDGRACGNRIPGPGAKGTGDTAVRNYCAWQNIRLNLDTICESKAPSTEVASNKTVSKQY